jgi:hypothetical protein
MRDRIFAAVLISIFAFKFADYLFTLRAIYTLGAPEANPLADMLLGTPWFFASKIILPAAGLWFVWRYRANVRPFYRRLTLIPFVAYGWLTLYHAWWQIVLR